MKIKIPNQHLVMLPLLVFFWEVGIDINDVVIKVEAIATKILDLE